MTEVDEANEILRGKGYKEFQLAVFPTPMASKLLIKGTKIGSPFADAPDTVLRAVRDSSRRRTTSAATRSRRASSAPASSRPARRFV